MRGYNRQQDSQSSPSFTGNGGVCRHSLPSEVIMNLPFEGDCGFRVQSICVRHNFNLKLVSFVCLEGVQQMYHCVCEKKRSGSAIQAFCLKKICQNIVNSSKSTARNKCCFFWREIGLIFSVECYIFSNKCFTDTKKSKVIFILSSFCKGENKNLQRVKRSLFIEM